MLHYYNTYGNIIETKPLHYGYTCDTLFFMLDIHEKQAAMRLRQGRRKVSVTNNKYLSMSIQPARVGRSLLVESVPIG